MDQPDRERLLRSYPALRELPPAGLARIEALAAPRTLAAGHRLFGEDAPASSFPLLLEGMVRVARTSADGREVLLYRLHPGEACLLSAAALLGETAFPAEATAESEVQVLALPRALFSELLLEAPAFRAFVFAGLSRRLAQLMALVDELVFRRVDQRLASRLLLHHQPLAATHQQLADDLGTSREVVSRILESFQASGIIKLGRKRIELLDREALEELRGRSGPAA